MSAAIRIRSANANDAAAVLEIERACSEAPHWSEWIWAQLFSRQPANDLQQRIQGPQRTCLVAERTDEVAGFLVLSVTGGIAELESVAVRSDARRCGVGRSLCLQALMLAEISGAESMELEVRSSSVAAVTMYRSLGFIEEGRRKGYYREPVDDALLMRLQLAGNAAKV